MELDFIYERVSVRKFKDDIIPNEDFVKMIKAAGHAPSGKNIQNWHFIVIKNKEMIVKMSELVKEKSVKLASMMGEEEAKDFKKYIGYITFFHSAPAVIVVYGKPIPSPGVTVMSENDYSQEELEQLLWTNASIQSVAAAFENLMLAAANMGYGCCWMTGPNYAAKEIEELIGFKKEGFSMVAMTPIGVPLKENKNPPKKPVEEIMTIIE